MGRRAQICSLAGILLPLLAPPAGAVQSTLAGRPVSVDTTSSIREVIEQNGATKHERTLEQLLVHTTVAPADWLRFEAVTLGANGGPTLKADRAGVYSWDDTFQDVSPSVDFEEAYVDLFLPSLDLRLGKQKVAWGKLDRFQPTDLINPSDYSDPFLEEEEERKLGIPAAQASYYLPAAGAVPPESRLTAVWVPRFLPNRFPLADCTVRGQTSHCDLERWFPPAAVPPPIFTVPAGVFQLNGVPNPALQVPLAFHVRNDPPPAWTLANSDLGLRYSALVDDVDFAVYYYHGFDTEPAFNFTADAVGTPSANPANPLHLDLSGRTTLSPVFRQIDAEGADFAYAIGGVTVRGEGAFVRGRPFSRDLRELVANPALLAPELQRAVAQLIAQGGGAVPINLPPAFAAFVTRDATEWGLGGDYVYRGYWLLLQVNQTDVIHNHLDLLIKNVETRLLVNLRKSYLSDRLETQVVAQHALESDYTFLRPKLRYHLTDALTAEIGYLAIAGRTHSLIGQYRRNDEGWLRMEYRL